MKNPSPALFFGLWDLFRGAAGTACHGWPCRCCWAACVAVSGVIGFVGLVAPHMLRHWLGAAHGPLLTGAWLGGGILLVWADVLARTALGGGQELPVGVVTALLGGPFFALLVRQRGAS